MPPSQRPPEDKSAPPAATSGKLVLARGQRTRLSDQLYGQIFEQIVSGQLKVGDRLPSEKEICDSFGVSRPVVREALLRLGADGLVTSHQGLGTFVSHQPVARIQSFARAQDVASYLRCQEVRISLEGDAARLAALRRTDEHLQAIEEAQERFSRNAINGRPDPQDDLAFHSSIAAATQNDFFLEVLQHIHESLSGFLRLSLSLTRTGSKHRAQRVVDEHAAIVDAIREQDGERARIAMQFHLQQALRRMVDRERDR
ncbi:FadR/GntR family transcriptional regulator [Caldimonas tepidiphila]|uniref:FadR/GntR family transcriptional regulator n=1 Tax=Caldimonas tepidiphila TaxID=2315841 RepID=UPI000E5BCD80|nr:FadR/GntR family transcriptional regulator [Caldimonas tepidiphila]